MALPGLACAVAILAAVPAGPACAGPYSVGVTQSVTHESNLLRATDDQVLPDGLSRSDTVLTTAVSAGIDQPIGRQRVFGNALLRHTRFERNSLYDSSGHRLNAGVEWATIGQLSGSVGATLQRNLAQFSNDEAGILTRSNIERTQQVESALRWGVSARLSAEASLDWRRVDFSAPEFASRAFRQSSGYLGLRHAPSGALWWSTGLRQSRGVYPNFRRASDGFEADHFDRLELEWRAAAKPSGGTELEARLGLGRTRYDTATSRDVSGLFGGVTWTWRPTGRLRLQSRWSRDPSQDSYFLNTLFGRGTLSYDRVATTVQLRADLTLSAKTSLFAAWGWTDRSLTRSIVVGDDALDGLRVDDRTRQWALGLRWQASRTLLMGLDLSGEGRSQPTLLSRPYSATSVNAFGQLTLQ
jgi:hypothetical protein